MMKLRRIFILTMAVGLFLSSPASAEWKTYEGIYYGGFELSNFYSCREDTPWWLEITGQASAEFREFHEDQFGESEDGLSELSELPEDAKYLADRLFVKIDGFLHPEGEYGHLEVFKYQVTVRKFHTIRIATETDLKKCDHSN
ncbi:MAG: hypothetical protein DHS20C05_03400 [Hyphococcus sp.]|nr:MAG: hypothetical protein DHS20C05_03400 [Marinicaulis sp.]